MPIGSCSSLIAVNSALFSCPVKGWGSAVMFFERARKVGGIRKAPALRKLFDRCCCMAQIRLRPPQTVFQLVSVKTHTVKLLKDNIEITAAEMTLLSRVVYRQGSFAAG